MVEHRGRCFVISPIGAPDSTERKHADDVFECIIRPAVEAAGYKPIRGDHVNKAGRITDQMIQSIISDDIIIAILTYANPNVYYELAIAQSACKKLSLLAENGTILPFDVKDERVIYYDLEPRSIFNGTYVTRLTGQLLEHQKESQTVAPFGDESLSPLGSGHINIRVIERFNDVKREEEWEVIENAEKFIFLSGISLLGWHKRNGYIDRLLAKTDSECEIRILMMHEENPALSSMLNNCSPNEFGNTKNEINNSFSAWNKISKNNNNIFVKKVENSIIYSASIVTENDAIISPYWYTIVSPEDYPVIWAKPNTRFYNCIVQEIDAIWEMTQSTED